MWYHHGVNPLRRVKNQLSFLTVWVEKVGVPATASRLRLRIRKALGMHPETWSVRPRQVQHTLTVRLGDSSDMDVFSQIFISEEYRTLKSLREVTVFLDLGANVGFASAYLLNCFPKARVISVEPDDRNVVICRANLSPYKDRARVLHGAVWAKRTALQVSKGSYGDGREWATQVSEPPEGAEGSVQAWDMSSLIEMAGVDKVDLLKVDIERAELAVFDDSAKAWLPNVRNICIELHGPDCEDAFFAALAGFDYELSYSGEFTICKDIRQKALAN